MQGLFGVIHAQSRDAVDPEAAPRALRRLDPPDTYETLRWADPSGRIVLGRLGLPTMAPRPSHGELEGATCFLDGEYLVRSGPKASEELQRSPELLLDLYRQHGKALAQQLQGWFLILIVDTERGVVHLWNDRFAHRPMHWFHDGQRLVLAPMTRMVQDLGQLETTRDPEALAQFFRYQQLLGECSLWCEIHLLPPGSHLTFDLDSGELRHETYWDLDHLELDQPIAWEDAVEEGTRLFAQACRRSLSGEHRFGTFLSGGLDSRMILAALGERARGFPALNYGVQRGGDVVYARKVARVVGADYHHVGQEFVRDTRAFCDEYFRFSYTPLHYFNGGNISINQHVTPFMDINLSGLCGESIMGDFFTNAPFSLPVVDHESMLDANEHLYGPARYNPGSIDWELGSRLFTPEFHQLLGDRARLSMRRIAESLHSELNRRLELVFMITRGFRSIGALLHLDRARFESRPLFYDYDFYDFCMGLPQPYRTDRRIQIAILNRLSPRLSRIPTAVSGVPPLLDPAALRRAQRRNRLQNLANRLLPWVPPVPTTELSAWPHTMRTDTAHWAGEYLLSEDSQMRPYLQEEYVRSLLRRVGRDKDRTAWVLGHLVSMEGYLRLG